MAKQIKAAKAKPPAVVEAEGKGVGEGKEEAAGDELSPEKLALLQYAQDYLIDFLPPRYKEGSAPNCVIPDTDDSDFFYINLSRATGARGIDLPIHLMSQTARCFWEPKSITQALNTAAEAIAGIGPKDEIEGMLAAQMVATHNVAMECLKRSMLPEQPAEICNGLINRASKLLRTYTTQMEALNRHQGKGQQKMTVEHVHVHQGGQAIVGPVNQGEGGRGNGKEQPHAVTYAPGTTLRSADPQGDAVPVDSRKGPEALPDARGRKG